MGSSGKAARTGRRLKYLKPKTSSRAWALTRAGSPPTSVWRVSEVVDQGGTEDERTPTAVMRLGQGHGVERAGALVCDVSLSWGPSSISCGHNPSPCTSTMARPSAHSCAAPRSMPSAGHNRQHSRACTNRGARVGTLTRMGLGDVGIRVLR
jgi:hypothetical protein